MNLIVDIGNTVTKLAIYKGREKISIYRINELSCEELEKKLSGYNISRAIVSSVKKLPPFISDLLLTNIPSVHILSHKSNLPFKLEYKTPETLGTDRIAAVAGAFNLFHGLEILIIDAGTAITFDFLSADTYKGGNISPGISMRFKALNKFTGKLPLISPTDNFISPGQNTIDAITAGVITGVTYEINEYIRTFEKKHTDFKIILTGGDSEYLKEKINHQLTCMPDIVIDGLNYILEYNAT
ncbi:MAG TPA: type III pantothenate kinase [Bacteroidales bacterium]|nr:type III pantothenate kinase [Bacteroidales bacterium]